MKRLTTILLLFYLAVTAAAAPRYTIFSVGKNVQIRRGAEILAPEKGMEVRATDAVVIGKGGFIEILNSLNSKIFKCEQEGEFSVTRIMIDAREANETGAAASILERTRFAGGQKSSNVYMETGMVKRSMATYDSEGGNIQIEPKSLSRHVVCTLRETRDLAGLPFPAGIEHSAADGDLRFHLVNTMDFPLYFNIIKVTDAETEQIDISELGQPTGCYVLLPGQAISREQFSGIDPKESHILIMTHCRFNIDDLMDGIDEVKKEKEAIVPDGSLSVYLRKIN